MRARIPYRQRIAGAAADLDAPRTPYAAAKEAQSAQQLRVATVRGRQHIVRGDAPFIARHARHWALLIAACALLPIIGGCHGKVVSSSKTPALQMTVTKSCKHSGYCYGCKTVSKRDSRTGKSTSHRECGNSYRHDCKGSRTVLQEQWTETRRYEDGYIATSAESRELKGLTGCK